MKINNQLIKGEIATANLTTTITNLPASSIVKLDTINSNTSRLSLTTNGGIKIGSGISRVAVSGNLFMQTASNNDYLYTAIIKNNSSNQVSICLVNDNIYYACCVHAPVLVDVEENDVIYLYKLNSVGGTFRTNGNTYLTVQVIA